MTAINPLPKPHKDRGMEGMVARWYATNTGKSLDEFTKLARRVEAELPPDAAVLEVAPGPGYFCFELAKIAACSITGLDISHTFVGIARAKAAEAQVNVNFQQGSASAMPFAANTFDFLMCRAAFKNFGEPLRALEEMRRVLKPGGRGMIIDLRRDASREAIDHSVDEMGLNPINRAITRLTFRLMLLKTAYTKQQFETLLFCASIREFEILESGIGYEIWFTKT